MTIRRGIGSMGRECLAGLILSIICGVLPGYVWGQDADSRPVRAALFYQGQVWVQDINVLYQIASAMQAELKGHEEEAVLSAYRLEDMGIQGAFKAAVYMGLDVVFCYGIRSEAMLEEYQKLQEAGIRIILVDGDVPESGRYAYIGTDNHEAGRQAASWLVEKGGKGIRTAILSPNRNTALRSVAARMEGFCEALGEMGLRPAAYADTTYDSLEAMAAVRTLLDENPDINVLFCAEAVSGTAAAEVIRERNLGSDILAVTYDWNERIEDYLTSGDLDMSLKQDTKAIGEACARCLISLARGEVGEDISFPCSPVILD